MINYKMLEESRKKLVSLKELMEILKMSKMSIYRLCERKELIPKTKYNGRIYFSGVDIYDYVVKKRLLTDDSIKEQLRIEGKDKNENKDNTGDLRIRIKI